MPINKDQLITELGKLLKGHPDRNHLSADNLLLKYINDSDITTAFERVPKPLSFGMRKHYRKGMRGKIAILYARWSPRRNEDGVESNEHQLADMREFCANAGITIAGEFEDKAASGGDLDRPGLWDAIDALKPGYLLLVRNYDRLTRDEGDAGLLMYQIEARGAQCFAVAENRDLASGGMAVLVRNVMFSFAAMEREQIRSRTSRAMRRHQHNGRLMSMETPYGTREGERKIIDNQDGTTSEQRTIEPDPVEQLVLKEIINRFKELNPDASKARHEPFGTWKIASELNKAGVSCRGGRWYHQTVDNILVRAGLIEPRKSRGLEKALA